MPGPDTVKNTLHTYMTYEFYLWRYMALGLTLRQAANMEWLEDRHKLLKRRLVLEMLGDPATHEGACRNARMVEHMFVGMCWDSTVSALYLLICSFSLLFLFFVANFFLLCLYGE